MSQCPSLSPPPSRSPPPASVSAPIAARAPELIATLTPMPDSIAAPEIMPGPSTVPVLESIAAPSPESIAASETMPGPIIVPVVGPIAAPLAERIAASETERGYVTAETALLLPILLGLGYALALVVLLAADQIRCADAAWEAARALARGVPSAQLPGIAARYAPAGAHASVWSDGGSLTVEIERDQSVASRFLPSVHISATATVPCESRVEECQTDSTDVPRRPNG